MAEKMFDDLGNFSRRGWLNCVFGLFHSFARLYEKRADAAKSTRNFIHQEKWTVQFGETFAASIGQNALR